MKVDPTDWRTEKMIEGDIDYLKTAAVEGIKRFAFENRIELNDWDIAVSKFAYHPIDSSSRTTQIAAYNAFASAMATWHTAYIGAIVPTNTNAD